MTMTSPNPAALAKPADPRSALRTVLEGDKMKAALRAVLPKHLTPERIVKVALSATMKQPLLLQCTRDSLLRAIMDAAELGLEPGGALGHAYLVPYRNKRGGYDCQLIPGYRGLIALARRSGEIASIEAHPVYANDTYRVRFGLAPVLEHEPLLDGDPGPLKFVYAIAKLVGGGVQVEVMTRSQVEAIKARSQGGRSGTGPWKDDYDEMSRKTVVRRIFKYLPVSTEMARALEAVDREESDGADVDVSGFGELLPDGEGEAPAAPTRADDLKAHLDATAAATEGERVEGGDDPTPPTGTDAPSKNTPATPSAEAAPVASAKPVKSVAGAKASAANDAAPTAAGARGAWEALLAGAPAVGDVTAAFAAAMADGAFAPLSEEDLMRVALSRLAAFGVGGPTGVGLLRRAVETSGRRAARRDGVRAAVASVKRRAA